MDTELGIAWDAQIKAHQEVADVYAFNYNYRGRNTSMIVPEWLGECVVSNFQSKSYNF